MAVLLYTLGQGPVASAVSPEVDSQLETVTTAQPADDSVVTPMVQAPRLLTTLDEVDAPSPRSIAIINTGGLGARVRAEPSTESDILDVLPEGSEVIELGTTVAAEGRVWHRIRSQAAGEGWIDGALLILADPDEHSEPSSGEGVSAAPEARPSEPVLVQLSPIPTDVSAQASASGPASGPAAQATAPPVAQLLAPLLPTPSPTAVAKPSSAPDPTSFTAGCVDASQSNGSERVSTILCSPGFALAHDRVYIYSRNEEGPGSLASRTLNMSDAVWLFDPGATGRASLIVDFHPNRNGPGVVADLYDDQNGDQQVGYALVAGVPISNETQYPTVRVISEDGWWVRGATINYNLTIIVDGSLQASFGSEVFYRQMATDGGVDFRIQVRDDNYDGRPDWELIRVYPPISENSAVYRSLLMVNPQGDLPISDYILWPFLGLSENVQEGFAAGRVTPYMTSTGRTYGLVKNYNESFAPIQVQWSAAKIRYVGEFVASRTGGGNWFIYSLTPFGIDGGDYADFENPFAFYDLAGVKDGYPDLSVRQEYYGPSDRYFDRGSVDQSIQTIRYSWDQNHDHIWDYKLGLLGRHAVDGVVNIGSASVRTIPYADFPRWVTERPWDIVTFVAGERSRWTTEGIYESAIQELVLRNLYLTGIAAEPPQDSYGGIGEGYRGEYALNFASQPYLYLSPIDRKLHMLRAEGGLWNIGGRRTLRYINLGGDYLNQWTLFQDDQAVASLTYAADQLVLADAAGIHMKLLNVSPAVFTTLPPTDQDEWTRLGALLSQQAAGVGTDLQAMFNQFDGPTQSVPGASLRDVRVTDKGFRTALDLRQFGADDVPWVSGVEPGAYLLRYERGVGYSIEPLSFAGIQALPALVPREPLTALSSAELSVAVRNLGQETARAATVSLSARRGGGPVLAIDTPVSVDIPGGSTVDVRFVWTPPESGDWVIETEVNVLDLTSKPLMLTVGAAPASDLSNLIAAQGFGAPVAVLVEAVLAMTALLAGGLAISVWHGHRTGGLVMIVAPQPVVAQPQNGNHDADSLQSTTESSDPMGPPEGVQRSRTPQSTGRSDRWGPFARRAAEPLTRAVAGLRWLSPRQIGAHRAVWSDASSSVSQAWGLTVLDGESPVNGVIVANVQAGSLASFAGVRRGDVLVTVAGLTPAGVVGGPVRNKRDLVALLRKVELARTVDLVVVRDGRILATQLPRVGSLTVGPREVV